MTGPKAPKDPQKKGSSFYICRQKEIVGAPLPDGTGVQFIYLNDERLVSFAKIIGNITDEAMLTKLRTAEGFLDMVAGIGVSVESKEKEPVDFVFQMYGKTDIYSSGTVLRKTCQTDGMETILWFQDYSFQEDDDKPGQIRFEFKKSEQLATVNIKLYLREGYEAPEQEQQEEIQKDSKEYQAILKRSLLQTGNNYRLKGFLNKIKQKEKATIAFIGGSITQGAGAIPIPSKSYAYKTWEGLTEQFGCRENLKLIKAGVGGTSSELGIVRFERDVLREGEITPDLIVIEYAVNDAGDETEGVCYEGLVRRCLELSEQTAVVLLFAVFADDWNLQERMIPIGERYELPMVSIKNGVVEQFYQNYGEGKVLSKGQFFYDCYHPTNVGHQIMADSLLHLFQTAEKETEDRPDSYFEKKAYYGSEFTNVHLIDRKTRPQISLEINEGSFCETDQNLQAVEFDMDFTQIQEFPNNWMHQCGREPFCMRLCCSALFMVAKDSGEQNFGKAVVRIDGKQVLTVNPKEAGWTHCNSILLLSESETKEHLIEISMQEGDENHWFTILGFGCVI